MNFRYEEGEGESDFNNIYESIDENGEDDVGGGVMEGDILGQFVTIAEPPEEEFQMVEVDNTGKKNICRGLGSTG